MTTLREAAQQALEALGCIEYGINGIEYGPSDDTTESAITALRAALEQQEQEPVTLERERAVELTRAYQEGYEHGSRNAQQEQEPVAWWIPKAEQFCMAKHDGSRPFAKAWEPLYTHPPRREWQGLTEENIQSIHDTYHKRMGPQEFARAVEAALKEKNQ